MIHLLFGQAVAYYVLLFIGIFIGGMAVSSLLKSKDKESFCDKECHLWQCSICTFVYASVFDQQMTVCPQCGSYNKKEVTA
ncbi:MAG: hypothetical protein PHO30_00425 [Candidatus Omnitrophica bacterium]|jgi:ribosomal protein L32|nr:hypothetical protein [Candidatus Omnitrophota bacterium]